MYALGKYVYKCYSDHTLYRLLKPGLSILFESGHIRTQVCLRAERACKQTNKQTPTTGWLALEETKIGTPVHSSIWPLKHHSSNSEV